MVFVVFVVVPDDVGGYVVVSSGNDNNFIGLTVIGGYVVISSVEVLMFHFDVDLVVLNICGGVDVRFCG